MSVEKLPEVINFLKKEKKASPSKIAEEIGSDRRTVGKILNVASDLGIITCNKLEVSGKTFQVCELNSTYTHLMQNKRE